MKGRVRPCGVAETCAGSVILLGLVAIAIGVYVKQFHYDRAMFLAAVPSSSSKSPPSYYNRPGRPDRSVGAPGNGNR